MRQRERLAANKRAFDEIIGDPYSQQDLPGHYSLMQSHETIRAVDNTKVDTLGSGSGINPAIPNVIDFLHDVECAVGEGLKKYAEAKGRSFNGLLEDFDYTYILQSEPYLNQRERAEIEQVIGQILIARKISPLVRYFTAIKQGRHDVRGQRKKVDKR